MPQSTMQRDEQELLFRRAMRQSLWSHGPSTRPVSMGKLEIERLIPHRAPFLLLDEITAMDLEQQALEGRRLISPDDPVFIGHFPDEPIYPGVLLLEMAGQLGLCLMALRDRRMRGVNGDAVNLPKVRLMRIHASVFLAPVLPKDDVTLRAVLMEDIGLSFTFAGQVARGETICALGIAEACYA